MVTRGSAAPAVASASPAGRSIGGGRRAVALRPALGALLVLTAAVGTFTVAGSDEAVPRTTYLVASRALRPGDTIGTGDVTEVAIDLPAAQRDGVATDPSALRDAVVRIPVDAGALLYESALDRAPEGATGAYLELSVSPPAAWAVAGRLDRGDRVLPTPFAGEDLAALPADHAPEVPLVPYAPPVPGRPSSSRPERAPRRGCAQVRD